MIPRGPFQRHHPVITWFCDIRVSWIYSVRGRDGAQVSRGMYLLNHLYPNHPCSVWNSHLEFTSSQAEWFQARQTATTTLQKVEKEQWNSAAGYEKERWNHSWYLHVWGLNPNLGDLDFVVVFCFFVLFFCWDLCHFLKDFLWGLSYAAFPEVSLIYYRLREEQLQGKTNGTEGGRRNGVLRAA